MYLNEEIGRLKGTLKGALASKEFADDTGMASKAQTVLKMLEGFSGQLIDTAMIGKVLKIQNLVMEIQS